MKQVVFHYGTTDDEQTEPCELLIVDDDPEVLLAAELVLKKHFPSVDHDAGTPAHPGAARASARFDVILLDMNFSAGADVRARKGSRG